MRRGGPDENDPGADRQRPEPMDDSRASERPAGASLLHDLLDLRRRHRWIMLKMQCRHASIVAHKPREARDPADMERF